MLQILDTVRDRGSRYAVTGGTVAHPDALTAFLEKVKSVKKFARATHNSWAAVMGGEPYKDDDGEAGAGAVILKMIQREGLADHVIVVTRWYGGVNLGGDRFSHVVTSTRAYLQALRTG
jgi:putative IMPACT (imprinted ancient) family translation regulator